MDAQAEGGTDMVHFKTEANDDGMDMSDSEVVFITTQQDSNDQFAAAEVDFEAKPFHQDAHTLEAELMNGTSHWRIPVEPIFAPRRNLIREMGIKHVTQTTYHNDCYLINSRWGTEDPNKWLPADLREKTSYSLMLLHVIRGLATVTKKNREYAHQLLLDQWRSRQQLDGRLFQDGVSKPSVVVTQVGVAGAKCGAEAVVYERTEGLMLMDVANVRTEEGRRRRHAKIAKKVEKQEATAAQRVALRVAGKRRKEKQQNQNPSSVELVDMELQPGMDLDKMSTLINAATGPKSQKSAKSQRKTLAKQRDQLVLAEQQKREGREAIKAQPELVQSQLTSISQDLERMENKRKSKRLAYQNTAATNQPPLGPNAPRAAFHIDLSSDEDEDEDDGGVFLSLADLEPSSKNNKAVKGDIGNRLNLLAVQPSKQWSEKRSRRAAKLAHRNTITLPSERTDIGALPSLHQAIVDTEVQQLMSMVGSMELLKREDDL